MLGSAKNNPKTNISHRNSDVENSLNLYFNNGLLSSSQKNWENNDGNPW